MGFYRQIFQFSFYLYVFLLLLWFNSTEIKFACLIAWTHIWMQFSQQVLCMCEVGKFNDLLSYQSIENKHTGIQHTLCIRNWFNSKEKQIKFNKNIFLYASEGTSKVDRNRKWNYRMIYWQKEKKRAFDCWKSHKYNVIQAHQVQTLGGKIRVSTFKKITANFKCRWKKEHFECKWVSQWDWVMKCCVHMCDCMQTNKWLWKYLAKENESLA